MLCGSFGTQMRRTAQSTNSFSALKSVLPVLAQRGIVKPRPIASESPEWKVRVDQWRFTGANHFLRNLCENRKIFRDVLEAFTPEFELRILFQNNPVICGEAIVPTNMREEPSIRYLGEPGAFYTVVLIDIDYPSNYKPKEREFLLWAKANVQFEEHSPIGGDVLCEYVPPCPAQYSGPHRICAIIGKQESGHNGHETVTTVKNDTINGRSKFSSNIFFSANNISPKGIVFLMTRYDSSVEDTYKQMGVEMPRYINPKTAHVTQTAQHSLGSRFKMQHLG